MKNARQLVCRLIVLFPFLACGCQSSSNSKTPQPRTVNPLAQAQEASTDALTDPSAIRLDNLQGALAWYYANNRVLPPTLADLDKYPFGALDYTSPRSGQPFTYIRADLHAVAPNGHLVVYDPAKSPRGRYWAIIARPATRADPVVMFVVSLDDQTLKTLLPGR